MYAIRSYYADEIAGATSASYTITNAALADAGDYKVKVTNSLHFYDVTAFSTVCAITVTPETTRITSYNVCYTKLLRALPVRPR